MANRTKVKLRNTAKQLNDSAVTSDSRLAGEPLIQKYSTAPTMISVGVGSSNVVDPTDVFVADSLIQPLPSLVSSTLIYTGATQAPVPSPYDDRFVTFTVTAQTNKGSNYTATFSLKKINNAVPNGVKWSDNSITDKSFTWSIVEAPTSAHGIPAGGTASQVISKVNGTDYNVTWRTTHEIPSGGTTGQALIKTNGTDYNVTWGNVSSTVYVYDTTITTVAGSPNTTTHPVSSKYLIIDTLGRVWYSNGTAWRCAVGTWASSITPSPSGGISSLSVTLSSSGWSNNAQTVTASGVTASNTVWVSPAPADTTKYSSAGIICTNQASNSLTFTCTSVPTTNITVNIAIAN